ncbi:hypothetical protein [Streptomyces formicae]|uniref:Integral membrane protein n=1 Tax=Streptomyces formicae TaxID=1616117 RepID=A0ABY3WYH3_9ACTN|nr:hypothetical protein [Streptomyces formicae]UNM14828.1 hypothetical protein J4032_28185 [Streptomyces formicae]
MTDKDVERTDEQDDAPEPWWAGLGTRGGAALIALGGLAAAWVFLAPAAGLEWLPGTPGEPAAGYYQAAKVIAIGLVIVGTTMLGSCRSRAAAPEETNTPERD